MPVSSHTQTSSQNKEINYTKKLKINNDQSTAVQENLISSTTEETTIEEDKKLVLYKQIKDLLSVLINKTDKINDIFPEEINKLRIKLNLLAEKDRASRKRKIDEEEREAIQKDESLIPYASSTIINEVEKIEINKEKILENLTPLQELMQKEIENPSIKRGREIGIWLDKKGNKGKTMFANHIKAIRPKTYVLDSTHTETFNKYRKDIIKNRKEILTFIFDIARKSNQWEINPIIIERLLNGTIKFGSHGNYVEHDLHKAPYVYVFCNDLLWVTKKNILCLSQDRLVFLKQLSDKEEKKTRINSTSFGGKSDSEEELNIEDIK